MLVTELTSLKFRITMTEEEKHHLRIITLGSDNKFVYDVETLLAYILTYTEQHWYDTIKEPPIVPLIDSEIPINNGT